MNLYVYCEGNPIRYADLDGHSPTGIAELLRNPIAIPTGLMLMFIARTSPYINFISNNTDKFASTADAAVKASEKYHDSNNSPDQDPDPNWNRNKNDINKYKETLKSQLKDVKTSSWNKGSFNSIEDSLVEHYLKHGNEVNAKDIAQYLRKSEEFMRNLKGAEKFKVNGYVEGAMRYVKNGRYIDIAPDGSIISFGTR